MRRRILIAFCNVLAFAAWSQDVNHETISLTLDSASTFLYVDFERTIRLTERAETLMRAVQPDPALAIERVRAYQIRIIAGRYFLNFRFARQNIDSARAVIEREKSALGERYDWLRIENELSLAKYFQETDDYAKALRQFKIWMDELQKLPKTPETCRELHHSGEYVAGIQGYMGEYDAAINQFLAGISYFPCFIDPAEQGFQYALTYRNIAQSCIGKRDFKNARYYLAHAEDSIRQQLKRRPVFASNTAITIYESQAAYYNNIGYPDSALLALHKAVPLLANSKPFSGRVYLGLGKAYSRVGKLKVAETYMSLAEKFFLEATGNKSVVLANTYLSMGDLFQAQNNAPKALNAYQHALISLSLDFNESDSRQNPNLTNILSKKAMFAALHKKSELIFRMYGSTGDRSLLNQAWSANHRSLTLLDSTSKEFSLRSDRIILAEQSFSAFETGIRIGAELMLTSAPGQFDSCFALSEKSKGMVLLENLRLVNRYGGVDPELVDRENELKSQLLQIEQALYKEELKNKHSNLATEIRQRYIETKHEYSGWLERIRIEAPGYYELRFDHRVTTPKMVRSKLLKPGEALIEYFLGDSTLTTFVITRSKQFMDHRPLPEQFNEHVRLWREMLIQNGLPDSRKGLHDLSRQMSTYLLKECLNELGDSLKSLIIVPDGVLGYLPFEVMAHPGASGYMNEHYSIRYANSATYLLEQSNKEPGQAREFFAGFVAAEGSQVPVRTGIGSLAGASTEVASIVDLIKHDYSVFNPAMKQAFISKASNFRILHLAMHSIVNDENPMLSELIFAGEGSDARLTAIELYNMQLNADMAVLSACNTGFGELHRGEGIMSLSRAFAYAGVPAAIISLWQVPDIATSKIMVSYYRHLQAGLQKDRALQQAKADFVAYNPEMSDPFYWSGFILNGNNQPIDFPSFNPSLWIGAGGLMLLIFFMIIRRAFFPSKHS